MTDTFLIPAAAWQRRLDARLQNPGKPAQMNNFRSLVSMMPMIVRMMRHAQKSSQAGFDPINFINAQLPGPEMGVPLGGIGSGSITRGWRGGFLRWQMRPGTIQLGQVFADQFSLFVQHENQPAALQVLAAEHPPKGVLEGWDWTMDPACATYHALFPRAWTRYEQPLPGVNLTCRQLSPVIGHNYRESCFPVSEFRWKIENTASVPARVGLMFTFQNGIGAPNDQDGGHSNHAFSFENGLGAGVELRHIHRQPKSYPLGQVPEIQQTYKDPLSIVIASRAGNGVEVTYRSRFTADGDGLSIWNDFARDGRLDNFGDDRPSLPGEVIGAGLAVTVDVPPGESREVAFSLAWAMPVIRSGFGTPYYRRYTLFYGRQPQAAQTLAQDALDKAGTWETDIETWQKPILDDASLPDWYKTALFNELYYLVDGGTMWCFPAETTPTEGDMGRFAYLESHEYRFYNTVDVHFYASFALIMNWPKIELAIQRDIGQATLVEDAEKVQEMWHGKWVPRKLRGAVPHDIGLPGEDPWLKVNGYNLHDVNIWKDLNPKLVLQVYRDYVATQDDTFLVDLWPAVEAAMDWEMKFDRDGDGMVENDGFPDQTYDVWAVQGPSAYTGGLWLAALSAAAAMAEILENPQAAQHYRDLLEKARGVYDRKLWNGRCYSYDGSFSKMHDSIMADQLAGYWYTQSCGLASLLDQAKARSALATVFEYNVQKFKNGQMGAVNGMRPGGQVDRSTMQSQEVWTGTTYAVAANMLLEGMRSEAFQTAYGIYKVTYEDKGYWFQTPEAWVESGNYRSNTYMRPLCIWAMQWALDREVK